MVSLGSPHVGAPLAQGVHWASAALNAVPETRPLASLLRRRSAGIRDLRRARWWTRTGAIAMPKFLTLQLRKHI